MQHNSMHSIFRDILSTLVREHSKGIDPSGYDFEVHTKGHNGFQGDGECHPVPDWRCEPRSSGYGKIREEICPTGIPATSSNKPEAERNLKSDTSDNTTYRCPVAIGTTTDTRAADTITKHSASYAEDNRINSEDSRSVGNNSRETTTSGRQSERDSSSCERYISSTGSTSEECNEAKTVVQEDMGRSVGTDKTDIHICEVNKIAWNWVIRYNKGE
jgi:hypothetical protein